MVLLFCNTDGMQRTLSKMANNVESKKFGSKHTPLMQIEPGRIVPDELHLFLRICDVLLQNLLDD